MEHQTLERAPWSPAVALGGEWLGKWTRSSSGYELILTDGSDFWGEERNSTYIAEKAEEWAGCLEAKDEDIAELVLSHLTKTLLPSESLTKTAECFTLQIKGNMQGLPYRWTFNLSRLSTVKSHQHWVIPLTATLEYMSCRILKLEDEVKKKDRQLSELQPSSTRTKDPSHSLTMMMDSTVQKIRTIPMALTLSQHLNYSPELISKCTKTSLLSSGESTKADKPTVMKQHRRPRKVPKGVSHNDDDEDNLIGNDEESERRSQILELFQVPKGAPSKKKKKMKI